MAAVNHLLQQVIQLQHPKRIYPEQITVGKLALLPDCHPVSKYEEFCKTVFEVLENRRMFGDNILTNRALKIMAVTIVSYKWSIRASIPGFFYFVQCSVVSNTEPTVNIIPLFLNHTTATSMYSSKETLIYTETCMFMKHV